MTDLHSLKDEVSKMLLKTIGIAPTKSKLKLYTKAEWERLASRIEGKLWGFYSERSLTAHVPEDSHFSRQILYHEFFGHGLHTEHTDLGEYTRMLQTELEQELKETGVTNAKTLLSIAGNPTISQQYIISNLLTYQNLKELSEETIPHCEGLALWTQWYISKLRGEETDFFDTFSNHVIDGGHKIAFQIFKNYSIEHGERKLLKDCGFRIP